MLLTTKSLKTHSRTCTLMKMDLLVVLLVLSEVLRLRLDPWGCVWSVTVKGCVWLWKTCLSFEQWLIKSWLYSFFLFRISHKGEFYLERFLMRQHCTKQLILVISIVCRLWTLILWVYETVICECIGYFDFDSVNVWNCDCIGHLEFWTLILWI